MARFDVYRLADGSYVLNCQADMFDNLSTRFVVPLVPLDHVITPMARINPLFEIDGVQLVMMTQFAGAIPAKALGKPVHSLDNCRYVIGMALDMLLGGS